MANSMNNDEKRKTLRRQWQEEREKKIAEGNDSTEAWMEYLDKFERLEIEAA